MKKEIKVFPDHESMSIAVAEEIINTATSTIEAKGFFSLALSGGDTPRRLYDILSSEGKGINWAKVHFLWGDERYVPWTSPESNYRMAFENLFSKIEIPESNINPIPTNSKDPVADAKTYEQRLSELLNGAGFMDLVLLGVGRDGHTASLFPGSPVLREKKLVAAVTAPKGYKIRERITLTPTAINKAQKVFFLVSGVGKKEIMRTVLKGEEDGGKFPAKMIRPKGQLKWFLDYQAAGDIDFIM